MNDDVQAEFVETTPGSALATTAQPAALEVWTPSFAVQVDDAIARKKEKRRFFQDVMDEGQHYGKIPGAGDKPALLKPGAEMLLSNMGLVAEFSDEEPPIRDLQGRPENGGEMLILYRRRCVIYRQTGPAEHDRMSVAKASGSCSSREKKYRWRDAQRLCPDCNKACIITGKAEYGGGFLCFKKKGGCGAKFLGNDQRITGQEQGQVANPDVADIENTILKMADKRALVAATLIATGCSDIFTQDLPGEDEPVTTEGFDKAQWQRDQRQDFAKNKGYSTSANYGAGGQREAILRRDGYACVLCNMTDAEHKAKWQKPITIDHINKDRSDNTTENLQTLCLTCHGRKDISPELTEPQVEQFKSDVMQRRANGESFQHIADTLGFSVASIWKWAREWGDSRDNRRRETVNGINGKELIARAVNLGCCPDDIEAFKDWARSKVPGCADMEKFTVAYAGHIDKFLGSLESMAAEVEGDELEFDPKGGYDNG